MLKTRIIPTLLWKNEGLVKGVSFDSWRRVGTVLPAIKVYNTRQVDELIVVDITATEEGREPDYEEINGFSAECFVPLTIGGGVKDIEIVKKLLRAGADKIVINSAAFDNPKLISQIANSLGSQCVVASIDAKKRGDKYKCFSQSGKQATGISVSEWAKELERLGAGEILITSIEKDGTMQGYDIELIKEVADRVTIPVIASGGAGNYDHMYQAIVQANASAVAAASIFHFTHQTPLEAKNYLFSKGIFVRNSVGMNLKNTTDPKLSQNI